MRVEIIDNTAFTIFEAPKLDPITVVLQDIAPKQGRMIIECYGCAWSAYWGGMGNTNIREFILACNAEYIAGKMERPRELKSDKAYLLRIVQAVQHALREVY
ncbi:MAG: hypothetical protein PHD37_17650 [Gallionellaceae bacterium]|nr:hypothetical protein [Gallionellaceae bacterium]